MAKIIISVRLSKERLDRLDELCEKRNITRSAAIDEALRIYPELLSGTAETSYNVQNIKSAPAPKRRAKA